MVSSLLLPNAPRNFTTSYYESSDTKKPPKGSIDMTDVLKIEGDQTWPGGGKCRHPWVSICMYVFVYLFIYSNCVCVFFCFFGFLFFCFCF